MKRIFLISFIIFSVALNVKYLSNKFIYRSKFITQTRGSSNVFLLVKASQFEAMPIHNGDVVFIGDSHTMLFPITEIYGTTAKNRGIAGATSGQMLSLIPDIIKDKPQATILQLGVNDLLTGQPTDNVVSNMRELLKQIKRSTPTVYLMSIFPTNWNVFGTSRRITPEIKILNKSLRSTADSMGVRFIDLYSTLSIADSLNPSFDCGDHLHLNAAGYRVWEKALDNSGLVK